MIPLCSLLLLAACKEEASSFSAYQSPTSSVVPNPEVNMPKDCRKGGACDLTPVATRAGVVTILFALGDIAKEKRVISEESGRLVAINAVKFASPVVSPKILVVKDSNHGGEQDGDTEFTAESLLKDYDATVFYESPSGLEPEDLVGYDVVWFNNPGHPMGSSQTLATLLNFQGGVILSGDDLTFGAGFSTSPLTGLRHINNGTSMSCDGQSFWYDNNGGYTYRIEIAQNFLPGVDPSLLKFEYGNDIDDSILIGDSNKFEVLAYADAAPGTCISKRPVIVRYQK